MMRYVFFQAHPDDLELNCAHLMHHLARYGHDIRIASVTLGEWGLPGSSRDHLKGTFLAGIRTKELARAASIHGIPAKNIDYLGYVDGFVRMTKSFVHRVASYLQQVRPDVIVGPEPFYTWYYHMDHLNTGRALFHIMKHGLANMSVPLYFYTSLIPNAFFPIRDSGLDLTNQLIECHKTQFWLLKWMKYLIVPTELAAGLKVDGWRYAEPYRRVVFEDESQGTRRVSRATRSFVRLMARTGAFQAQYPAVIRRELGHNSSLFIDSTSIDYWSEQLSRRGQTSSSREDGV